MASDPLIERLQAQVGSTLGEKYHLDALLGIGGMAAVYAATHRNGARVAIKVLHRELAKVGEIRARFLREGYAANKVGHPGVVRVQDDVQLPDGTVFLVMDLLEGRTLEVHRQESEGRLPLRQAVHIMSELLDIVAAAHAQRIIHRDIKPDNIFLTMRGEIRLMDFGIARLLDSARMTGSGAVMGTPAFMSPEQAASQNRLVDAPSDVWSLGAVFFQLLTGEDVHRGRTGAEQMIFAATQPAPKIGTLIPSLPMELADLVDVALAFEIKSRFQSAAAMGNALRHVVQQHGLEDAPAVARQGGAVAVPSARAVPTIGEPVQRPVSMTSSPTLIHGSGSSSSGDG